MCHITRSTALPQVQLFSNVSLFWLSAIQFLPSVACLYVKLTWYVVRVSVCRGVSPVEVGVCKEKYRGVCMLYQYVAWQPCPLLSFTLALPLSVSWLSLYAPFGFGCFCLRWTAETDITWLMNGILASVGLHFKWLYNIWWQILQSVINERLGVRFDIWHNHLSCNNCFSLSIVSCFIKIRKSRDKLCTYPV